MKSGTLARRAVIITFIIAVIAPLCPAQEKRKQDDLPVLIGERGWSLPVPATKKPEQDKPAITLRIDTDVVTVDVVATDKNGNYVRDLRRDELQLFENGAPRKVSVEMRAVIRSASRRTSSSLCVM